MRVATTKLPGVLLIEPHVIRDGRGYFAEAWHDERYAEAGVPGPFVQENLSVSTRGVLRGLHLQVEPHAQAKLVTVLAGVVWDVVVDVRLASPGFGQWEAHRLTSTPLRQLYVPRGFAHGFAVLSDEALVTYQCTAHYRPEAERTLLWNDPDLAIEWPFDEPILSDKDGAGLRLQELFGPESR